MVNVTVDIPVMSRSILCPGKKLLTPMVKGALEVTPASKLEPEAGTGKYSLVAWATGARKATVRPVTANAESDLKGKFVMVR
jgi:hypothetical protein